MNRVGFLGRALVGLLVGLLLLRTAQAYAATPAPAESPTNDPAPAPRGPVAFDRVAVRVIAPETGGIAHPRFLAEREVAFFSRLEARMDGAQAGEELANRYVRLAIDRLVARTILASLMIQRGLEPLDLQTRAREALDELTDRVGPDALRAAQEREGIDDEELMAFLRNQVRAAAYMDRSFAPIFDPSEEAVREAYRAVLHPFRPRPFEEVSAKLSRWLVVERQRAAEVEFLQTARARINVVVITGMGRAA